MFELKRYDSRVDDVSNLLPYIYCERNIDSNCDFSITEEQLFDKMNQMGIEINAIKPDYSYEEFKQILLDEDNSTFTLYLIWKNNEILTYALLMIYDSSHYFVSDIDRRVNEDDFSIVEKIFYKEIERLNKTKRRK